MHIVEHGMWKANATSIEKYARHSPETDEAIVRVCKVVTEVCFVGVRRNGMARWAFVGLGIYISRGDFAELERIVHEAAAWLWEQETA